MNTHEQGARAEARAAWYLAQLGFSVLRLNYRYRRGELDLIATEDATLCFIEVRARRSTDAALASVGWVKQRRLVRTAEHYLTCAWRGPACPCRFDVVSIADEGPPEFGRITLIRDAFRPDGPFSAAAPRRRR